MTFAALGVPSSLAQILEQQGITTPTPIQAATLPDSLAGRDVLGRRRTGSGKTYAFLLPLVARLDASKLPAMPRKPRALILAPTRELVGQIHAALLPLAKAAGLSTVVVYGGVGQNPQVTALKKGVDIVLACPGRLEDLMGQGYADLSAVEITILDEADHMADLGFLPGVRRIMDKTPQSGQRMLFSATLDKAIDVLVKRFLTNAVTHEADSAQSPVSTMSHHVLHVSRDQRVPVLVDLTSAPGRTVVFTRTKHGAKALARQLNKSGVPSVDLHGNLSQNARTRNMEMFHSGKATTLVATDIAARGIHVDDVALVIHADPPTEHKAYLHRSGRTARAGAEGTVITLMTDEQQRDVRDLTRQAGIKPVTTRVSGPGHAMLEQLAPGERSTPGGLVVEVSSSGGGGRSTGANAQRKRARSTGQTNGQSRRGNPTSYTSETPSGSSTGGGQRRRSSGGQGGQGGGQGGGQQRSGGHSASSFSRGR
jgi:superfamily II DNA/RNA helicase